MIPQERVNEAAKVANDYTQPMNIDAFYDGFDCGVRFAEAEPQTFEVDFCGHVKAKVEFKDSKLNTIAAMNGYGEPLDPDQITITQSKSELTCPICQSNRILEWPDKYQCRKCEHVWVKLCSCGADHSPEAKYANLCNYCLKPIK